MPLAFSEGEGIRMRQNITYLLPLSKGEGKM
jgi:hypothetical protein